MRCRIQNVTKLPNGTVSTKDREVTTSGNRVRIGRGTDNDIVLKDLAVAFRHADIVVRDFDIVVEAEAGSPLLFDDVPAARGALTPETVVGIGPYQIRLLPPERGFDLALSIESGESAAAAPPPVAAAPLKIQGGLLARRPLSWLLFAAVLVGCLILPVLAHLAYRDQQAPAFVDGRTDARPPATLLAGFDHAWDTGELSDPHKFLEQRCEACHVAPFQAVRNEDCGACHATVRHHFNDPTGLITTALRDGGHEPVRCVACHAEHQGADGAVPRQQALCAGCHQDLPLYARDTQLANATDFGSNHPQFKPTVVVDAALGKEARLELGGPVPVKESSGLRFDHACHLGGERAQPVKEGEPGWLCAGKDGFLPARAYPAAATGEAPAGGELLQVDIEGVLQAGFKLDGKQLKAQLGCGSCHLPDAGGAIMRPVDMEDHCSYCHTLQFDAEKPDRVLPHGEPEDVRDVLVYYYFAESQRPAVMRTETRTQRRRPGAKKEAAPEPGPTAQSEETAPNPLFAQRLERVFANNGTSTCGYCHQTTATPTATGTDYGILPVQVQRVWEPLARFDHAPHANLPCAHCHAAATSSESSDVLLPPIANCRECHLGEAAQAAVPSTCVMCHVYHPERATCPMVPAPGTVPTAAGAACPATPAAIPTTAAAAAAE
jgi:predicted CXXCH cytochrome family protein